MQTIWGEGVREVWEAINKQMRLNETTLLTKLNDALSEGECKRHQD